MDITAAIAAWRELLGDGQCLITPDAVARYTRTLHGAAPAPSCALYPVSLEQVREVVRIASAQEVPLYPLSRGKNWGYGDATVLRAGAAILDLSRMNRIVEINRDLAYAVLEPGVSQQALFEALQSHAPELVMDSTGAGFDASILGNALERGFGHTPYGDHCRTTCSLQVVLADGSVLETGFGHFANARARAVFPYGIGPSLNELFTQSNFGVVTQITLWLAPKPEAFQCFYLLVDREDALPEIIERLRPLRLRGVLNSAVHLGNDLRVISSQRSYPWEAAGGTAPLPDSVRRMLRQEAGLGAWNLTGSLSGTHGQVRSAAKAVRRALGPLGKLVFVGDRKIALAQRALRVARWFGGGKVLASRLEALIPNYGLLRGTPTNAPLRGVYWRLREETSDLPLDPLETATGLYWISPVLPILGAPARQVMEVATRIFTKHSFDVLATFTLLNERSMVAVINIAFDRRQPEETLHAEACYDETMAALLAEGFVPYRASPRGMRKLAQDGDVFWEVAGKIKAALDPQGIFAPGKYIP